MSRARPETLAAMHFPCARCYSDSTATEFEVQRQLVHFECPRGHLFTVAVAAVRTHSHWLGRMGVVGRGKLPPREERG